MSDDETIEQRRERYAKSYDPRELADMCIELEEADQKRDAQRPGSLFRVVRVAAGLSLRTMAARLDISAVELGMFERGLTTPPKHRLRAFFRVLGEEAASQPAATPPSSEQRDKKGQGK